MAGRLDRKNTTGENVRAMIPAGTGGNASARVGPVVSVVVPIAATATRTAWINPEPGTVLLTDFFVVYTTAGTGTIDVGRTDDGTAAANGLIDGGTMTVGVHWSGTVLGTVAASATIGGVNQMFLLVGPGGTGTANSITVTDNEAGTGTAVGYIALSYLPVTTLIGV
jgi:hypothetical protein